MDEAREADGPVINMDVDVMRDEFGSLHMRLCAALSDATLYKQRLAVITDRLVKATAKIAEMERESAPGGGLGKP